MKGFTSFVNRLVRRFTTLSGVETIKRSLISLIPILLIGAFSLTARYFPIAVYQSFLESSVGSFIGLFLDTVYGVTFGLLSVYMCISIGYHYAAIKSERGRGATIGCILVSVACFVILTDINVLSTETLGPKGMFIAIIASLSASALFCALLSPFKKIKLLADGADINLNSALGHIFPIMITIAAFALTNYLRSKCSRTFA